MQGADKPLSYASSVLWIGSPVTHAALPPLTLLPSG
jgi:hypothetical protein